MSFAPVDTRPFRCHRDALKGLDAKDKGKLCSLDKVVSSQAQWAAGNELPVFPQVLRLTRAAPAQLKQSCSRVQDQAACGVSYVGATVGTRARGCVVERRGERL